jgi:hypothetical protein
MLGVSWLGEDDLCWAVCSPALSRISGTGLCTAGYACPPRSTSPTAVACAAGQLSAAGAATCSACPGGQYIAAPASTACFLCPTGLYGTGGSPSAACSGPCDAGSYGAVAGLNSSTCSGMVWPVACGLWPVACGLWPVACGLWPVACGLWPVGVWGVDCGAGGGSCPHAAGPDGALRCHGTPCALAATGCWHALARFRPIEGAQWHWGLALWR